MNLGSLAIQHSNSYWTRGCISKPIVLHHIFLSIPNGPHTPWHPSINPYHRHTLTYIESHAWHTYTKPLSRGCHKHLPIFLFPKWSYLGTISSHNNTRIILNANVGWLEQCLISSTFTTFKTQDKLIQLISICIGIA